MNATGGAARLGRAAWLFLSLAQRFLVVVSGVLLTALIFVQVVTRYVFGFSFYGLEEVALFFAVWFYFLGSALAGQEGMQISASLIDVLTSSERVQHAIRIAAGAISVAVGACMVWWSIGFAAWSARVGQMSIEADLPMIYAHLAIPIGLGLMTFYLALGLAADLASFPWKRRP